MMNLLALGLIVSTLTAAGVLTPPVDPPHHSHQHPASDHVLREGHRIIVLEYERQFPADSGTGIGNGEAGLTGKTLPHSTKERICDAYGVCRDKLSGAASEVEHAVKSAKDKLSGFFHHGKDKVADADEAVRDARDEVLDAKDAAKNKLFQAKEVTEDKVSEAKDTATTKLSDTMDATREKLSQAKEVTKDKLSQVGEKTMDFVTGAKEASKNKAFQAKEATKDKLSQTVEVAQDKVLEAKGKIGDKFSDTEEKAKEKLSGIQEEIRHTASSLKEGIKRTKEKPGDIAEEAARNLTDITRRAREVAYDMATYAANPRTSRAVWSAAQLLGFATAYGTCVWVTFISSHVLAVSLPRQQFGMVQSKVYPVYFRAVAYGVSTALLAQIFGRGRGSMVERLQTYNLLGALGMVLVNMFFIEPTATKIMFERMKAEKEEGRGRDVSDMVEPISAATTPSVTGLASVTTTTTTNTMTGSVGSFGTTKSIPQTEEQSVEAATENKLRILAIRLRRWNSYSSLVNVLTLMALTWHLVHLASQMSCCQ